MRIRIGINGFGRIGRDVLRASLGHDTLDVVAVNDVTEAKTLAHILKYDSVWGTLKTPVQAKEGTLVVNGKEVKVLTERDPEKSRGKTWAWKSWSNRPAYSLIGTRPPNTWRPAPHAS